MDIYNPKQSFENYLNDARESAKRQDTDALARDLLRCLEELHSWMDKVDEKLPEQ
jgi:hypothetical protein